MLVIASVWLFAALALADEVNSSIELSAEEAAYRQAIAERVRRIVDSLGLEEAAQGQRVADIVANQYRTLRDIHGARDDAIASLKKEADAAAFDQRIERQKLESERAVVTAHRKFVAMLGAELDSNVVDQIKDGMTYGVVPITYKAYLELLPDLKAEEKRYIKACLLEAREYAMDAGSSDEKHAWFGKYKGRINNYLSARGYDLKQAEREMAGRRDAEDRR